MTTHQIASRLADLCKQGKFEEAQKELYSKEATSTEPREMPPFPKEVKGLDAILKKSEAFNQMVEALHSCEVGEPVVADHSFAFTLTLDSTWKGQGRSKSTELCVYEVKDGKIVAEQFFM
jgi:hypothetical protein